MTTAPRYLVQHSTDVRPGATVAAFLDAWSEAEVRERADWLNPGRNAHDDFGWQPMPIEPPSECFVIVDTGDAAERN